MNCKPSFFSQEDWCKIPFSDKVKTSWDLLLDILLSIPSRLLKNVSNSKTTIDRFINGLHENATLHPSIEEDARKLLIELGDWWWNFENEAIVETQDWNSNHEEPTYSPNLFIYRDSLTANTVALYNSASLIAYSSLLASSKADDEDVSSHEQQILSDAASIISLAAFEESIDGNYGDLARTVFPLTIVTLLSPSAEQRTQASSICKRWTELKGVQVGYDL